MFCGDSGIIVSGALGVYQFEGCVRTMSVSCNSPITCHSLLLLIFLLLLHNYYYCYYTLSMSLLYLTSHDRIAFVGGISQIALYFITVVIALLFSKCFRSWTYFIVIIFWKLWIVCTELNIVHIPCCCTVFDQPLLCNRKFNEKLCVIMTYDHFTCVNFTEIMYLSCAKMKFMTCRMLHALFDTLNKTDL